MQEANLTILKSQKANIEEIVPPLDAAQLEIHGDERGRIQNSLEFIMGELTMTVLLLTGSDYEVADRELEFLNAMQNVVFGTGARELTSNDYIELCREFLRIHPNSLLTVDRMPLSIRLLMNYDTTHGTQFADKARAIFVQFADALVNVDQRKDSVESIILLNFKDTLGGR